jgi:hypothetical protein
VAGVLARCVFECRVFVNRGERRTSADLLSTRMSTLPSYGDKRERMFDDNMRETESTLNPKLAT